MPETFEDTELAFKEEFAFLEKVNKIKADSTLNPMILKAEYGRLAEKYAQLLKNAVRIAKMGDKAQKKLIKYKDLLDTMRNIS